MSRRTIQRFEIIPRRLRARGLVPRIRHCSRQFRAHVKAGDTAAIQKTSERAWDALTKLFEILRGDADEGRIDLCHMDKPTAFIVSNVTRDEQAAMLASLRIDRGHTRCSPISLRETLNKIAHHHTGTSTYRIDQRGAHYLLLAGDLHGKRWVAEILVSRLCNHASTAVQAIRG